MEHPRMKTRKTSLMLASIFLLLSGFFVPEAMATGSTVQRDVLPPTPQPFKGKIDQELQRINARF
jgi:hypothetical protein